jgi:hypothetical protein
MAQSFNHFFHFPLEDKRPSRNLHQFIAVVLTLIAFSDFIILSVFYFQIVASDKRLLPALDEVVPVEWTRPSGTPHASPSILSLFSHVLRLAIPK